jgi:hypothetical protein
MATYLSQLGDEDSDLLVKQIIDNARTIWPVQTTETEAWINKELTKYGISYAKYQTEQSLAGWLQSPIIWIVGIVVLLKILK